jgi:NAD(P)-dependent dehydrogenase (short-subunit alcohol dehydrogenase family)
VKTCVITGATSGLGRATALALAAQGADLILIGRNQRLGEQVATLCRDRHPESRGRFLRADLSSLPDVRAAARTIAAEGVCIDVLVNNAGARYDTYADGPGGLERTFAGNHLGHFLLTHLLLPQLSLARPGRVVTVGSVAHLAADLSEGWVLSRERYDRRIAYANSKLANIVFARELASRNDPSRVTSNAADPGIVVSRFARNNGLTSWMTHIVAHALRLELTSSSRAADTIVYLASAETVRDVSGLYFRNRLETTPSPLAVDPDVGRQLWNLSVTLTGLAR